MIYVFLLFVLSERATPFIPVLYKGVNKMQIRDYFEFLHLKSDSKEYKLLKTTILALKNNLTNPHKDMQRIKRLAKSYNTDAMFVLGTIFEYGLFSFNSNDTKARKYYSKAADLGHVESMYAYSFLLRFGKGGMRDIPQGVALVEEAARKGCVSAKVTLATMQKYGINMQANCALGISTLEEILDIVIDNVSFVNRINNPGVARFAKDYIIGEHDKEYEAFHPHTKKLDLFPNPRIRIDFNHYYNSLLEYNNTRIGKFIIGMILAEGEIGPPDIKKAIEYFNDSFEESSTELAKIQLEINETERQKGYRTIMNDLSTNIEAKYVFALESLRGKEPFSFDVEKAVTFLHFLKKSGHLKSIYMSGKAKYYHEINGCDKGFRNMLLAGELSFLFNMNRHAFNSAIKGDFSYAIRIYERLADMGSEAAMFNAEKLLDQEGKDSTDMFELQVAIQFHSALKKYSYMLENKGKHEEAIMVLKKAAGKEPSAAFKLAMTYFWRFPIDSLSYLKIAEKNVRGFCLPTKIATIALNVVHIIKGLLDIISGKNTDSIQFIEKFILDNAKLLVFAIAFVLMSMNLKMKVEMMEIVNEELRRDEVT